MKRDRPLRVAMIASFFPQAVPGGMQNYVMARAAQLGRRCEVAVLAMGPAPATPSLRTVSLGRAIGIRHQFLAVWWRLLLALWRFRPDVIEVHYTAVAMPLLLGVPFRYFFHGPMRLETRAEGLSERLQRQRYLVEKLFVRVARRVYADSQAFLAVLLDEHPELRSTPRRLRQRYPCFLAEADVRGDDAALAAAQDHLPAGVPADARILLCVRRLVPRTGVDLLLRAFDLSVREGGLPAEVHLLVAGTGVLEAPLRAQAGALASRGRIHLLGQVSNATRTALFRRAAWNVVPTLALEGFGLVVVEAALLGCPSIVTRVGALPEVVALLDGEGLVCDPEVDSLAAALLQACSPAQPQIGRAALQQRALRRFAVRAADRPEPGRRA